MIGLYKKHPLLEKLKAAKDFCNEWRDTIYHGVCGLGIMANQYYGWDLPNEIFFFSALGREALRAGNWSFSLVRNLAGIMIDKRPTQDQCVVSSIAGAAGIFAQYFAMDMATSSQLIRNDPHLLFGISPFLPAEALILTGSLYAVHHCIKEAGGLKEFARTYKYMWDYPRNKGGGGQTEKAKKGLAKIARKLLPSFGPDQAPR